jgi:hypothetical protein
MWLLLAFQLVAQDPEPACNLQARIYVASKYSLEELDEISMMRAITNSDILTRQYSIARQRCLDGKPLNEDQP